MLFSVVIPLYNKADTIERTIRSVWAQSFNDYELIVVNDGSTDGSLDVVTRLSSESPIVIIDKKNGGVSSARNAGANVASGRYIALLDGDDIWYPNHLEMLASAIMRHPNLSFFGMGYERMLNQCIYYTIPWGGCCVKDVYSAFRYGQPINSSTVAIERCLWHEVGGFDESLSYYEDYEFFFRLGQFTKCCIVRKISGRYMDDASMQATSNKRSVTPRSRPHLAFVEDKIQNGTASDSMISCARTHLGLMICSACTANNVEMIDLLLGLFPNISAPYRFMQVSTCIKRIVNKLYAKIFIVNYKIRCHLVVWRRHE